MPGNHSQAPAKLLIGEHFKAPVEMLDYCGHRLHPVAAIEIVDLLDVPVGWDMNMSADHALAAAAAGKQGKLFFEFRDEVHRGLNACFDLPADREVLRAM